MPNQTKHLNLTPLAAALLACFSALAQQASIAAPAEQNSLPDLGNPSQQNSASIRPGPNGLTIENSFDRKKLILTPEYSNQTGMSIGATLAAMLGDNAAIGVLLTVGADKTELLLNAGFKFDKRQNFIVTVGQLDQFLDYAFLSGTEKVGVTQTSGALGYQLQLGQEFLRFLEVNGYVAKSTSRELANKTFTVDTATVYELWSEPRRIAGGTVTGLQARLGFSPINGSVVKVSLGSERLSYDLLSGADNVDRLTGGIEWLQQLGSGYQFKVAAEAFASQNRYTLGMEHSLGGSNGHHNLGISLVALRGRDGLGDDSQLKLTYTYVFGARAQAPRANTTPMQASSSSGIGLLNLVAMRPGFIPSHVVAKVDNSVRPARLIAVDKTALPTGASVDTATGDVSAPLGLAVTGIAGVTKNLVAFANVGQFSLSGNSLVIKPSLIVQPAVGVIDTYVVTVNNLGGGTSLITVQVSHGSVKIDRITIVSGDTTAPLTTAAPVVSGTTDTGTTLSVTINENGTGYYLIQPAATPAPTVAAVQAGTSFVMTANVAATATISGLAASTAYKIYFVAKDAANNVQAAVKSINATTTAAPDITAPTTAVAPFVFGTSDTGMTLSATLNETGTGYFLVLPTAAAAPSVAAVQAGTAFAMSANVAATAAITGLTASTAYKIYFIAKDTANNLQTAVQSVAATTLAPAPVAAPAPPPAPAPDVTAPVTTVAPSVSGTTATATTLSATINETGTGYYLVQAAAAVAPTVAAVQAGTSFAMTANVAATPAISGLTASTAYKIYFVAKDAANNVQAAVQNVAVTTTAAPDVTAPTTTVAPAVSGTTDTATTLSVSINEAGTGYYLVQAAAAAAPTVAAVQAGTSFAMTANVAATPAISGLTASTAYKVYFVAKDAANNVQAAVQNVAITTTAAPDVTAPTTTVAPSISGTTDTGTTFSATINEAGTGYYLVQAAAATAPTVAAVQAGTSFAMTANVAATPAIDGLTASTAYKIYFVAKDAANNVQAAVQSVNVTTTAAPDITPPVTTVAPAISVAATDTTASVTQTINENGTGYYLVLPAASAAPTMAAVKAGTSFAMTGGVVATVSLTGLAASTPYKYYFVAKDSANNDQAAVSTGLAITTTVAADVTPPTTPTISINSGAITTNITSVSLSLSGSDNVGVTGWYVSESSSTPSLGSFGSIPSVFTLSTGDGTKTVHAWTRDAAGNVSGAGSATITLDTTPPAAPTGLAINGGASSASNITSNPSVSLDGLTTPPDADLAAWFVSESSTAPAATAGGWTSTKPTSYTLAGIGMHLVSVHVKDTSGNVQPISASAWINLVP